jgi:hypothetical protein
MIATTKSAFFALLIAGSAMMGPVAYAQDASPAHISAARKALTATKATDSFDSILLNTSANLKNNLTSNNPNLADQISIIVDEEAIALAARRGDLEQEAARLFANAFTEEELTTISTFFSSAAGQKYLDSTPILARELGKAARVWATGIARDLEAKVAPRVAEAAKTE